MSEEARELEGWTEVAVQVNVGWHELVADVLAKGCDSSVSMEGLPTDLFVLLRGYRSSHLDRPQWRASLEKSVFSLAERVGEPELHSLEFKYRFIPVQDFANAWKSTWKPIRVNCVVIAPPEWTGKLRESDIRLDLIPGGAFGTGHHATTRACIKALPALVSPGDRILDAGCGSGILGVLAAKLGAKKVLGFDIDSSALPYAVDLARENGVELACEFRHGGFEVLGDRDRGFQGVVANLYGDLLQAHAQDLSHRLEDGGWFSFSGCSRDRVGGVEISIDKAGLDIERRWSRGKWVAFHGRKRPQVG